MCLVCICIYYCIYIYIVGSFIHLCLHRSSTSRCHFHVKHTRVGARQGRSLEFHPRYGLSDEGAKACFLCDAWSGFFSESRGELARRLGGAIAHTDTGTTV